MSIRGVNSTNQFPCYVDVLLWRLRDERSLLFDLNGCYLQTIVSYSLKVSLKDPRRNKRHTKLGGALRFQTMMDAINKIFLDQVSTAERCNRGSKARTNTGGWRIYIVVERLWTRTGRVWSQCWTLFGLDEERRPRPSVVRCIEG